MTPEYLRSHRSTGMNIQAGMGSRGEKIDQSFARKPSAPVDEVYERELRKIRRVSETGPKASRPQLLCLRWLTQNRCKLSVSRQ